MLPKKIRLTTAIFDQVFKTGKVSHSRAFWLRSVQLPEGSASRFAAAVSKKVAPTAVLRNRIRRIVYQAIEKLNENNSTIKPSQSFIIGVKSDITKIPSAQITQELNNLLKLSK